MDKFGSRIVENIISLSDHQVKRAIMDELAQHEEQLSNNRNGWFVARKVGLHTFRNRPGDWRAVEQSREKKKRVFSEFLSGPLGPNRGQGPSSATFVSFNNNNNKRGRFGWVDPVGDQPILDWPSLFYCAFLYSLLSYLINSFEANPFIWM